MQLTFERGSGREPKGHALAYIRNNANDSEIFATYLIVPPINIDLSKYMPAMFASKISLTDMQTVSSVPLPPVPERVESFEFLKRLADVRDDDLIYMGTADPTAVENVLVLVTEAAQSYLSAYTAYLNTVPQAIAEHAESSGSNVADVLYGFMSERDKLGELSKMVGKLRYAVEGSDPRLVDDVVQEMQSLAEHVAPKYRPAELIEAAKSPGEKGRKLCELMLARSYKLCDEDYAAAEKLDAEIKQLQASQ